MILMISQSEESIMENLAAQSVVKDQQHLHPQRIY